MTELFDWIVGTSTGGILALLIVYGVFCNDGRVHGTFYSEPPELRTPQRTPSSIQNTSFVY